LSTSVMDTFATACITNLSSAQSEAYAVHPVIIDASLQVGLAALTKGLVRNFVRPQVPTHIDRLDVYRSATTFQCLASYSGQDEKIVVHGAQATGDPVISLKGLKLTELASVDQEDAVEDRYGGARLHWVVDPRSQETPLLIKTPSVPVEDRQVIEELALICIIDSVALLQGLEPSKGHLSKYRAWLEWVAKEALSGHHPILENTAPIGDLSAEDRQCCIHQLYTTATASSSMSSFAEGIFRVYSNIQKLFTGQADVLELLLRENTLTKIYDTISFDYSRLVEAYLDQKPNLRILEVGAGTGGSTELILQRLHPLGRYSRYGRYTFTDISAGFFPAARERFATAANMDFMVFDIAQDPLTQGFEPDSYDLIIAANVVHATPRLSQTLQHLQFLLAPGGRLLLTEFCTCFRAPNFIYGNFSGWWLGEADDRKWEPYVGVSRWDKELKSVGMSGATEVILDSAQPMQYCATIISQKPDKVCGSEKEILILCNDHGSLLNQRLIQGLQEQGLKPRAFLLDQELPGDGDIIVSLNLESRAFHNLQENEMQHLQHLFRALKKQAVLWLMPQYQLSCDDPKGSGGLGMLRTARSELDLYITTLEIDPDSTDLVRLVLQVFRGIRKETSDGMLYPDLEYVVHDGLIHSSRYRPLSLEDELLQEPPLSFDPEATYMLTGGLGGLGRTISVWLAERGARHLIFLSPNAGTRAQDCELFVELDGMGCNAIAVQGVAQSDGDVARAVSAAICPIKGVLHLSM
jgi:SAM-dependent methyltransferase